MLDKLLQGVEVRSLVGDGTVAVGRLEFDSRKVVPGTLFFATRGTQADGHAYIPAAVAAGAAAVVCEELPAERPAGVTFVQVPDSTVALVQVASAFYGHPSRRLKLVGVTGTNGKTTTATLLYRMFRRLGYKAGLISTVVYCVDDREIPSTHTTPDSIRLNAMMAEMVEAGCDYCFMEVSSHSLVQHRTAGLAFIGSGAFLVIFALFPNPILRIFTDSAVLIDATRETMYAIVINTMIQTGAYIVYNAVSGTGNTRVALLIELIATVVYGVAIYIVVIVLRSSVALCWLCDSTYALTIGLASFLYLWSGRWKNRRV